MRDAERKGISIEELAVETPDGVLLRVRRCLPVGDGGSGRPLVVPNGIFLEGEADFGPLAAGREVVFYDLRGRGRSDAVTDPERLGIERDVEDLETVRSALGFERMDLLGHSYLGLMVILYALDHPERVGRIVQVGPAGPAAEFLARTPRPGADPEAMDLAAWQALLADRATPVRDPVTYSRRFWEIFLPYMFGDPEKARAYPMPDLDDVPNEWPSNMNRTIQAVMASMTSYDVRERAGAVEAPVLVVHGTKDRNAPYESGPAWRDCLGNARLLTVEGAAHMPWAEEPEAVLPAIERFLNGDWPEAAEGQQEG